jgi:hypothetical protein
MSEFLKKVKALFITLIGWFFLLYLWYKMMFSHNGIQLSLITFRNIGIFAVFLLVIYFLLSSFNIEKYVVQSVYSNHFISCKTKAFPWVEIAYDKDDKIVHTKNRNEIICQHKEQRISSSKRLSYSAILLRDGYIKEAIGFLRQIQYDPYASQLARKIADSELNLLFNDLNTINNLKEPSE